MKNYDPSKLDGQLEELTEKYHKAEHTGFTTDWRRGKILADAYVSATKVLDEDGAEKRWSKWVRKDLDLPLRTAQRYRDVYRYFDQVGDKAAVRRLPDAYLKQVGFTKLDLAQRLLRASAEERAAAAVENIELTDKCILVTFNGTAGGEESELSAVSVRELRKHMPMAAPAKKKGEFTPKKELEEKLKASKEKVEQLTTALRDVEKERNVLKVKVKDLEAELERLHGKKEVA
jgi:hypothetical protein